MVELQFYMGIVRFGNGIFPISRSAIQNGIVSTVKDFCSRESAFPWQKTDRSELDSAVPRFRNSRQGPSEHVR
jgi:hypothetical protein